MTSPLPLLAIVAAALLTVTACGRWIDGPARSDRLARIDGLRGYLALFVFVHHGCIWYHYLQHGRWEAPPSYLYTHLGQSSVALFFMITGLLFFGRVLAGRERPIDWGRLAVSRVMRLAPLYFSVLALLCIAIWLLSAGELKVPAGQLATDLLRWSSFTVAGAPDLNQFGDTWRITAGVTWSLPYEWLFYASLPLQALLLRARVGVAAVLVGGVLLALILAVFRPLPFYLATFASGMFAAWLARSARWQAFAERPLAGLLALACLALLVLSFPSLYDWWALLLLGVAFCLIAGGSDLFGLLRWRPSVLLGEISYSVYLLHGIVLFTLFHGIVGVEAAARWSPLVYSAVVVALTLLLVALCTLSFVAIERPGIRATDRLLRRRPAACVSPG